ncbi:MAG TPA: hypothetical protein V6D29_13335 [Leptolyngbyaceae cyanobacterium]
MTRKIPLKPKHLALGGVFLTLVTAPRVVNYTRHQFQQELQRQEAAVTPTSNTPSPQPSQIGAGRISEAVLTRATYLISKGRESGNVQGFIEERYQAVNNALWDLKQKVGAFDGDASAFGQLTNLSAEQQAIELAQFWLEFPQYMHTAQGMSLNVQPLAEGVATNQPEVDYANVQP